MTITGADIPPIILVVEDEALLRMHVVDLLECEGFTVVEADCVDAALTELAGRADIAMVFTDIQMPGRLDGLALARHAFTHWPHILMIVTSGHVRPTADDMPSHVRFIAKPYASDVLLGHINELLRAA